MNGIIVVRLLGTHEFVVLQLATKVDALMEFTNVLWILEETGRFAHKLATR